MSIESTIRGALAGLHDDIDKRLPAILAAASGAEASPVVKALETAALGPALETELASLIGAFGGALHPVDLTAHPNYHAFGGPSAEPATVAEPADSLDIPAEPVTVADQRAAGVAPGDTVTVADQRAGAEPPASMAIEDVPLPEPEPEPVTAATAIAEPAAPVA